MTDKLTKEDFTKLASGKPYILDIEANQENEDGTFIKFKYKVAFSACSHKVFFCSENFIVGYIVKGGDEYDVNLKTVKISFNQRHGNILLLSEDESGVVVKYQEGESRDCLKPYSEFDIDFMRMRTGQSASIVDGIVTLDK